MRARFPWEGGSGYDQRPDTDPTEGREPGTPATPELLGAGIVVSDGVRFEDGHARRIRGRDGAARALMRETQARGYGMTWDQARDRASTARAATARRREEG